MFKTLSNWITKKSPAFTKLEERNSYLEEKVRHAREDLRLALVQDRVDMSNQIDALNAERRAETEAKLKERDDRIAWLERIVEGWEPERKALLEQLAALRPARLARECEPWSPKITGRTGITTCTHPTLNNHIVLRLDIPVSEDCFRYHPDRASHVRYLGEQAAYEVKQALRRHLLEKGIPVL